MAEAIWGFSVSLKDTLACDYKFLLLSHSCPKMMEVSLLFPLVHLVTFASINSVADTHGHFYDPNSMSLVLLVSLFLFSFDCIFVSMKPEQLISELLAEEQVCVVSVDGAKTNELSEGKGKVE